MRSLANLSLDQRIDLWDAVLVSTRAYFRRAGLREVSTPVRVEANAVEPFIEPIVCGSSQLQTSPELHMKQILGGRSIYQIAHCFRSGERGPNHREEFHLIEWYRLARPLSDLMLDIERLIRNASHSAALLFNCTPCEPERWKRVGWFDLFEHLMGTRLRGDEDASALEPLLTQLRSELALTGDPRVASQDSETARLYAWVELFSLWSDARLDPWLETESAKVGVHLVEFPAPLAALSRCEGGRALRFESYFKGRELANAYDELRDAAQQALRFDRVNQLRIHLGQAPLPVSEPFLEHLRKDRLPACVGAAMGLERLIGAVCSGAHFSQFELCERSAVALDPG